MANQTQEWIGTAVKWTTASVIVLTVVVGGVYEFAILKQQVATLREQVANLPPEWLQNELRDIKEELKELKRKVK